jgi:hypothetical protein
MRFGLPYGLPAAKTQKRIFADKYGENSAKNDADSPRPLRVGNLVRRRVENRQP